MPSKHGHGSQQRDYDQVRWPTENHIDQTTSTKPHESRDALMRNFRRHLGFTQLCGVTPKADPHLSANS